jgi:branched-chain amino acid transport system substrate-binding protein
VHKFRVFSPQRRIFGVVIASGLVLAASACSSGGSSTAVNQSASGKAPYTVAMIGDMSGPYASIVSHGIGGFETAIDAVNAAGGVNGRKIVVSSPLDAQSTAGGAETAFRQAVGQAPDAIFMTTASTEIADTAPVAEGAGITLLAVANDDGQAVPPKPYYYSTTLSSAAAGQAYANAIKQNLGTLKGKNVAIIVDDSVSTIEYGQKLQALVQAGGGKISNFIKNDPIVSSFTTQAGLIMQDPPDAIMLNDSPTNTVVEVTALKAAGYKGPIFGGTAADDDATLQKTAELGVDYLGPRELNTPVAGDAAWSAAVKYGHEADASEGIYFSKGYILGYAFVAGLKKCGDSCDAKSLPAAMASVTNISAPGNIPFGVVGFSASSHVAEKSIEFFKYDTAQHKVVADGGLISVS